MPYVAGLRKVALDTTAIRHFHDAGLLTQLALYLRENAYAAEDVHRELAYQGRTRPDIARLQNQLGWPKHFGGQLPKETILRGKRIQELLFEDGDPPDAHLGEIYTVLAAKHFDADLVITDDGDGVKLAKSEKVPVIRVGTLVAEMVTARAIDEEAGWSVYKATRKKPKRVAYDALVAEARGEDSLDGSAASDV